MDDKKNIVGYVVACIIIVAVVAIVIIFKNKNNAKDEYEQYLKKYKVNEYIPVYISDEEMAKIYLNDFLYQIAYDMDNAYELLDEEYRNKKFGSIDNFIDYINSLEYQSFKLKSYYKSNDGTIFKAYDANDNLYIFKVNGVMQYKVYLDDYTVEIGD